MIRLSLSHILNLEFVRRGLILLVCGGLFDAPLLLSLRMAIYKLFFSFGKNTVFARQITCIRPHGISDGYLRVGRNVGINHHVEIDYSGGVTIEDDVWISQYVIIETHEHSVPDRELKGTHPISLNPLLIERDSWIGAMSVILPGVNRIGRGAVVGAGSVVTKDIDDWMIVGGVPARVIGERSNSVETNDRSSDQ